MKHLSNAWFVNHLHPEVSTISIPRFSVSLAISPSPPAKTQVFAYVYLTSLQLDRRRDTEKWCLMDVQSGNGNRNELNNIVMKGVVFSKKMCVPKSSKVILF